MECFSNHASLFSPVQRVLDLIDKFCNQCYRDQDRVVFPPDHLKVFFNHDEEGITSIYNPNAKSSAPAVDAAKPRMLRRGSTGLAHLDRRLSFLDVSGDGGGEGSATKKPEGTAKVSLEQSGRKKSIVAQLDDERSSDESSGGGGGGLSDIESEEEEVPVVKPRRAPLRRAKSSLS